MLQLLNRLVRTARNGTIRSSILDEYVKASPSEQFELDLFRGEWSSALPAPYSLLEAGAIPLFQDDRLAWAIDELGGVAGDKCLELGPLEGGHSYMLEQAGAGEVLAVEANQRAFLKCLVVKNLLGLKTRFLLGDFVSFLESDTNRYDLVIASGVLYHMREPARVLGLIADRTDRIYLWTHYFDEQIIGGQNPLASRFCRAETLVDRGKKYTVHKQTYDSAGLANRAFCGGGTRTTNWMTRESILRCLGELGFHTVRINFDQKDHNNGPCFAVLALREKPV